MFRTQNLCPGSKRIFCFPSSKICFRSTFPARQNWATFASATMFPSLARPLGFLSGMGNKNTGGKALQSELCSCPFYVTK